MCDFEKGFKLCTCNPEGIKFRDSKTFIKKDGKLIEYVKRGKKKKNTQPELEYIWELYEYLREDDNPLMGRYLMPSSNLGKGLDAEWVALNLNCENCFDFEYSPREGDNLIFTQNRVLDPYLSFIYLNGV